MVLGEFGCFVVVFGCFLVILVLAMNFGFEFGLLL